MPFPICRRGLTGTSSRFGAPPDDLWTLVRLHPLPAAACAPPNGGDGEYIGLPESGRPTGLQSGGQAVPGAMVASRLSHRRAGDRPD